MDPTLFRLRVRYVKSGRLRYLGHLEVARTQERAVRRAGLPFAVTQGFSPHMRIAYSPALPVGTASVSEWYDLALREYLPAPEALALLREATPHDLAPQQAGYLDVHAPTLGAFITRQEYEISLDIAEGGPTPARVAEALRALRAQGRIAYLRGAKARSLDLSATLLDHEVEACEGGCTVHLVTRFSNEGSMRPEILLAALDRLLAQGALAPDEAVSSAMSSFACFPHVEIVRCAQYGCDADGKRKDPL